MPLENYICIHKTSFRFVFHGPNLLIFFFSLVLAYIVHPIKNKRKKVLILPFPIAATLFQVRREDRLRS